MRLPVWAGVIFVALVACINSTAVNAKGREVAIQGNPGAYFGPDAYPVEALKAEQQGRVVALLGTDAQGRVASCKIEVSSGSDTLDRTTCQIALQKLTFTPATDRKNRPMASMYHLPVRWVLPTGPEDVDNTQLEALLEQTVSTDDTGEVTACNFKFTPTDRAGNDPCGEFPVGSKTKIRYARNGKPIGVTLKREMRQRIVPDF